MSDNFYGDRKKRSGNLVARENINRIAKDFLLESFAINYSYDFDWLGVPIIQYPEDIVRLQNIVWNVKPDCIVETGVARGGSLMLSASLMMLLEQEEIFLNRNIPDFKPTSRKVIGIDVDIRKHNREKIESHFLASKICLLEGSSVDFQTFCKAKDLVGDCKKVMVLLDSHHSEQHVLDELRLYSSLVSPGSYVVVYDTVCEVLGVSLMPEKGWSIGDNPYTAVEKFLRESNDFTLDANVNNLVTLSTCQSGYLLRNNPA